MADEKRSAKEKFFNLLFVKYEKKESFTQYKLELFYDKYKQKNQYFDLLDRSNLKIMLETYRRDNRGGKDVQGLNDEEELPSH